MDPKDPNLSHKGTKMSPKGSNLSHKGTKMSPKGPNLSHGGTKMSPKGAKRIPKVSPKSTKIPSKNITSKKVDSGGSNALSFGLIFDIFLVKKCVQKSMRKTMPKKASKITKIKQKTGYDSIPRNAFSHRLSAKAVPPK